MKFSRNVVEAELRNHLDDDWGRDPAVREARALFSRMEQVQEDTLLHRGQVPPFDARLRRVRATALSLFEKTVALAAERNIRLDPAAVIELYKSCLQQALIKAGMAAFEGPLPEDARLQNLVREVCR